MARRTTAAVGFAVMVAASCAPAYQPPAFTAPMLEGAGDLHVAGATGTQGGQLHGAYAWTDHVAMRGLLQSAATSNNYFHHLGAGLSYIGASGFDEASQQSGLRWSLGIDSGLAAARGVSEVRVGDTTSTTVHEGTVVRSAAQGDFGFETPYIGAGVGARLAHIALFHSARSDRAGSRDNGVFAEAVAYVRPGLPHLKLDLQAGIALPVGGSGGVGIPLPMILSVGVAFDR